jgi:hypothetical protein
MAHFFAKLKPQHVVGTALAIALIVAPVIAYDPELPSMPASVIGAQWRWVSLTTPAGLENAPEAEGCCTVEFSRARRNAPASVSVQTGCNNGGASYLVSGNRGIAVGPMGQTLLGCPGRRGDKLIRLVGAARSYFLKDGDLFLEIPFNKGVLRFERCPGVHVYGSPRARCS